MDIKSLFAAIKVYELNWWGRKVKDSNFVL